MHMYHVMYISCICHMRRVRIRSCLLPTVSYLRVNSSSYIWQVITAWGAYISVHLIMLLAIYLLAPNDFVQMYTVSP